MTDEQASKFAIEAFKNQALKVVKETFKTIDKHLQMLSQKQEYALVYDLWKRKNYTSLTIEELKNIKSLDLGYTEIVDLPFEFMYLESLESLNLSGNNLQKVPECVWELKNLKELSLGTFVYGGNPLYAISPKIKNLQKLEILDVRLCKNLKTLPQEILQLPNLCYIRLSEKELYKSDIIQKVKNETDICPFYEDDFFS